MTDKKEKLTDDELDQVCGGYNAKGIEHPTMEAEFHGKNPKESKKIDVPILTILPIPSLGIEKAEIDFEINPTEVKKSK